jgi:hypothetical protein
MNCQVKDELVSQLIALNNKLDLVSPDLVDGRRVSTTLRHMLTEFSEFFM